MHLPACPAALCTTSTCCFIFRAELGQVDPCSNLVGGRGSPIPSAALRACGEQRKQRWCQLEGPLPAFLSGQRGLWSLSQEHGGGSGSPRGCAAHACSGHMLLGKSSLLPFALHVFAARAQLGRALQRAQASDVAAASPACCQGGWVSLSNQQEAV